MIHSIMMYSIDSAVNISELDYIAEWIGSNKGRHKKANGERVHKGNQFTQTGECLSFPGSPEGSIANIAQCNCILCYYIALSKHRRRV